MKPHELFRLLVAQRRQSVLQVAKAIRGPSLQGTLHKFLAGQVAAPSRGTATALSAYFGVPIEAVYDSDVAAQVARARGLVLEGVATQAVHEAPLQPCPPQSAASPATVFPAALLGRVARLERAQQEAIKGLVTLLVAQYEADAAAAAKAQQA